MGFWETVGKASKAVGTFAANEVKEAKDRHSTYSQEMPDKSDRELAKIVVRDLSSTPLRSMAARRELNNRGIESNDEIRDLAK